MASDENKWARERGYWERNGPDFGIIIVCVIFLGLMIGAAGFVLLKPEIPGLAAAFKPPPPPPPAGPSRDQKFHYSVPGEAEVLIFPGKPVILPTPAPEKPQGPAATQR